MVTFLSLASRSPPRSAEWSPLSAGPCTHPTPPSLVVPFPLLILPSELYPPPFPSVKCHPLGESSSDAVLFAKPFPTLLTREALSFWYLLCFACILHKCLFTPTNKINAQILAKAEFTVSIIHLRVPAEVQEHKFSCKEICPLERLWVTRDWELKVRAGKLWSLRSFPSST